MPNSAIPAEYQISRIFKDTVKKSGSYDYVKVYTDGENYIYVSGVYDVSSVNEAAEIDVSVSSPTPIGNAP